MRKISIKKWLLAGMLSLLVILLAAFWHRLTANPQGKYLNDKIGYAGLSYYEFKDGKVFLVLSQGYDRLGGKVDHQELIATYSYAAGKWTITSMDGSHASTLDMGLLSIRHLDQAGNEEAEFPRLFSVFGRIFRVYSTRHKY
jgi:hypothetical protein